MTYQQIFKDYWGNILSMAAFVAWLWFFPLFGILQTILPVGLEKTTIFNLTFLFATIIGYLVYLFSASRPFLKQLIAFSAPSAAIFTWLTVLVFWQNPLETFATWEPPSLLLFIIFPAIMGMAGAVYFAFWGTTIFYVPSDIRGRYMGAMVATATFFYSVIVLVFQTASLPALFLSGLLLLIPSFSLKKVAGFVAAARKSVSSHALPFALPPAAGDAENISPSTPLKAFWFPFTLTILCFYILAWSAHDIIFSIIKTESILLNVFGQLFYALVCLTAAYFLDRGKEIEKTAITGLIILGCTFLLLPIALSLGIVSPLYFLLEGSYGLIDLFMWVSLAYFCHLLGGDPGKFYAVGLSLNVLFIVSGALLMPFLDLHLEGESYILLSLLAGIILFCGILPALSLRKVRLAGAPEALLERAVARELGRIVLTDNLKMDEFTRKEKMILRLILSGKSNPEISDTMEISKNTLKTHVRHIYEKAGVKNRSELLFKVAGRANDLEL